MVDDKVEMDNETENYSTVSTSDPKNVQELTQFVSTCIHNLTISLFIFVKFRCEQVQTLLQSFQDKFQTMSDQILTRIDEMGNRIDDLEKNIADLMTQAGVEGPDK